MSGRSSGAGVRDWSHLVKHQDLLPSPSGGSKQLQSYNNNNTASDPPAVHRVRCSVECKNCKLADKDIHGLVDYLRLSFASTTVSKNSSSSSYKIGRQNESPSASSQHPTEFTESSSGPDSTTLGTVSGSQRTNTVPGVESAPHVEYVLSVDASSNCVTGKGVTTLMNFLKTQSGRVRLKCLKLFKNLVDDAGARAIADYVESSGVPLEELHLSHNRISKDGAFLVLRAFTDARCLPPKQYRSTTGENIYNSTNAEQNGSSNSTAEPAQSAVSRPSASTIPSSSTASSSLVHSSSQQPYVYPRYDPQIVRRLPIWVRLEYNLINSPEELLKEWSTYHHKVRNSSGQPSKVPVLCFAERGYRNVHVKDPHCSPIRCVHSLKHDAPILHLYSFCHQGHHGSPTSCAPNIGSYSSDSHLCIDRNTTGNHEYGSNRVLGGGTSPVRSQMHKASTSSNAAVGAALNSSSSTHCSSNGNSTYPNTGESRGTTGTNNNGIQSHVTAGKCSSTQQVYTGNQIGSGRSNITGTHSSASPTGKRRGGGGAVPCTLR
eukprot:Lankesteria_metandrocarpae@DN2939_c0_g1_i2.p1